MPKRSVDAQRRGSLGVSPGFDHVIAVQAVFIQGALAQGVAPGYDQPFRDDHVAAVAGELDPLDTLVGVDGGEVGRLHPRHLAEQRQQWARQLFEVLRFGDGLGEK